MLSIIISSYQPKFYNQLVENIAITIGKDIKYEIIQIDNPNLMSITKAYNTGAKNSKFENLLFLHEDLIFHTKNWGEKLIFHLQFENTGIIGLAGSSYVPTAPCSWMVADKYNFVNILQGNKNDENAYKIHTTKGKRNKVFGVDGVFLAIKKENYLNNKFNEELSGFHGYDLDFSLSVSKKLQNYIVDDILIQHFSKGNLDKIWFDANVKVRQKQRSNFQKYLDSEVEKNSFLGFLYNYFQYNPINLKTILFSLKFYPLLKLNLNDNISLVKKYFNYIRYSSNINERLK